MATFYIQLQDKLLQISGELTAENISKALGYVPVSPNVTNELSQRVDNITFDSLKDNPFLQDGSGELNIVDEAGNIIAKIDAEGIHSVDFIAGNHKLTDKIDSSALNGYATESYVNTNLQNYATKDEVSDLVDMSVVTELQGKVNTLIDTDSDKSVRDIAVDVLTETLVSETATEAYDTLAEMSAWIKSHPEDAAAMNTAIQKNATDIQSNVTAISNLDAAYKAADAKVLTDAQEYTDNINFYTIKDNPIVDNNDGNLTFVDETGNIGLQFSNNAILANDVITPGHTLSSKANKSFVEDNYYNKSTVDKKIAEAVTGGQVSLDGFATEQWVNEQGFLKNHQDISHLVEKSELPTKVSDLINDSGFITIDDVPTESLLKTYTFLMSSKGDHLLYTITQEELEKIQNAGIVYIFIDNNKNKIQLTSKIENDYISFLGYDLSLYPNIVDIINITIHKISDNIEVIISSDSISIDDYISDSTASNVSYAIGVSEEFVDGAEITIVENFWLLMNSVLDEPRPIILRLTNTNNDKEVSLHGPYTYASSNDEISIKFIGEFNDLTIECVLSSENSYLFGTLHVKSKKIDLSDYVTKEELNSKQDTLINGTTIKTINGQSILGEGDISNLVEKSYVDEAVKNVKVDLTGYATEEWVENKNYLTEHQDISHLATKAEIPTVPTKVSELENDSKFITLEDVPEVSGPTKTSELTNDSGFITINDIPVLEIPEEYVTETELNNKGFLTEHLDITNKQDKLISGTNIKTINGESILGEGDITIEVGTGETNVDLSEYPKKSELSTVATSGSYNDLNNKPELKTVATTGSYDDLINKPVIPSAVTETTVSNWGFTKNNGTYSKPNNGIPKSDLESSVQQSLSKADTALQSEQYKGTITGVSANGTSVATSGVANIPAASTSKYGVTKLSTSTSSTSTSLAATASAVKQAYDLANGKQDKLVSGTNIKTINGESILGSGNIVISGGSSSNSGGNGAYSQINHGTSDTTFTLTPNTFHVWNTVTSLDLSLGDETAGVMNEYIFQFTSGETATSLSLPSNIKWVNDLAPEISSGKIYLVSILSKLACCLEFIPNRTITFTLYDLFNDSELGVTTEWLAEEGMTWRLWVESEYSLNKFHIYDEEVYSNTGLAVIDDTWNNLDSLIVDGLTYNLWDPFA